MSYDVRQSTEFGGGSITGGHAFKYQPKKDEFEVRLIVHLRNKGIVGPTSQLRR